MRFFFALARGNFSLVSCCVDQVPRRGKEGQGPFFVVRGLFTLCAIAFVNNSNLWKIFFVVPFGREFRPRVQGEELRAGVGPRTGVKGPHVTTQK